MTLFQSVILKILKKDAWNAQKMITDFKKGKSGQLFDRNTNQRQCYPLSIAGRSHQSLEKK